MRLLSSQADLPCLVLVRCRLAPPPAGKGQAAGAHKRPMAPPTSVAGSAGAAAAAPDTATLSDGASGCGVGKKAVIVGAGELWGAGISACRPHKPRVHCHNRAREPTVPPLLPVAAGPSGALAAMLLAKQVSRRARRRRRRLTPAFALKGSALPCLAGCLRCGRCPSTRSCTGSRAPTPHTMLCPGPRHPLRLLPRAGGWTLSSAGRRWLTRTATCRPASGRAPTTSC